MYVFVELLSQISFLCVNPSRANNEVIFFYGASEDIVDQYKFTLEIAIQEWFAYKELRAYWYT